MLFSIVALSVVAVKCLFIRVLSEVLRVPIFQKLFNIKFLRHWAGLLLELEQRILMFSVNITRICLSERV